jgi:hypothetical protein
MESYTGAKNEKEQGVKGGRRKCEWVEEYLRKF